MTRVLRALPLLAAACAASPTAARFEPGPGFPWTMSFTGTETASALVVDRRDWIWVAGTMVRPWFGPGRDVLWGVWSSTQTAVAWTATAPAQPLAAYAYDHGFGTDEGEPALAVTTCEAGGVQVPHVFLVFTTTGAGSANLTVMRQANYALTVTPFDEDLGGTHERAAAVFVEPGATPYVAGWTTANGVDQLVHFRYQRTSGTCVPAEFGRRVTATFWTGSLTLSITGRAVVVTVADEAWVVARSGAGDLWLLKYGTGWFDDTGAGDRKALLALVRVFPTAGQDEPRAAALDVTGALWVAGSIDGDAALWRFDGAGDLMAGFPIRVAPGGGCELFAVAVDAQQRAFATGRSGGDLLFVGVDRTGGLLPGFPLTASRAPETLVGRGIGLDAAGAAWIAATVTAAPATWGGTTMLLYRYLERPDPLPLTEGELTIGGPGGGVLNLLRGETLAIRARPRETGVLRVQVLTLRGEPVREFSVDAPVDRVTGLVWDGRNAAGQLVASGTYAIRVTGAGYKTVKRILVLRRP